MISVVLGKLNYLVEANCFPDWLIRIGIRALLASRLDSLPTQDCEKQQELTRDFVKELKSLPIAVQTKAANEQHYEVPTEYYDLVLGKRKKYSCCIYPHQNTTLDDSENFAFETVCQRAEIKDGMKVVDLGCGWGSLTLYLLEKYPNIKVHSISNSRTQI